MKKEIKKLNKFLINGVSSMIAFTLEFTSIMNG